MRAILLIGLCVCALAGRAQERRMATVHRSVRLMGTTFQVFITAEDEDIGRINLEEAIGEMRRVEQRISSWQPDSETSRINRMAGQAPVAVSRELFHLLQRATLISELTSGAFDITVAAMDTLWRFDGSMRQIPDAAAIGRILPLVGYSKLVLDPENQTAYLPEKGMKIAFGAIGKGYAADRAKALMQSKNVPGGMINAGGDITVWGTKASGEKWHLGIADPMHPGLVLKWVPLIESSVGMVEVNQRYVEANGRKFGQILDPRTGVPASGTQQVIVLARSAEFSDALATALCVLGPEASIRLVEQLGDTEAVIVDSEGLMFWTSGLLLDPGK